MFEKKKTKNQRSKRLLIATVAFIYITPSELKINRGLAETKLFSTFQADTVV